MADLSLCLTNVNVSLGRTMEADKRPAGAEDLERVEMGNSGDRQGRVKLPRRTIHFASGETMEEYSTDEEEEEEPVEKKVVTVDASNLTWGPYLWFHLWRMATSTISVCDYMGEKLASLFGITAPKYQYAIDEYYRLKKEQEEEEEENRLADEAERQFTEQQRSDKKDSGLPTREQPERLGASFLNASFDHKPEAPLHTPDNRPPCPLPF
ncbi:LOW QUALITY PROTEIN: protein FAM177A1 [Syngnathoides biaculeatus]|uniref:LOW QUALITY PROTEIN: protein FAM177A1 n=1 Tax=Syngnathoides biaculeatus TaxID=300417 RepID=UPI002ADE8762|nr:LOW QUALITY PROTEIN: protein FAM177A1 [Syngnathoides biaculeatus]